MSDPYNPQVVGSWEGPGYSTYLHPIGDDLMLTIGVEGDLHQVSLYDLSDLASPALVERLTLPDGAAAFALLESKAFTYSPSRDALALPFVGPGTETGVLLYDVDALGLGLGGALALGGADAVVSPAQRAVMSGDYLYGVSRCRIPSASLAAPDVTIDTLPVFAGSCTDPAWP